MPSTRAGTSEARVYPAPLEAHLPRRERLAEGVFVGRQAEIGMLQAALEDALAGRGRLVLLAGEPGIGKTRTAREFASHARERGALVRWGRCHESAGMPSYWPWVQLLRAHVRDGNAAQIRTEMGTGAADIATLVPEVREQLLDLPGLLHLEDPEQARFRLFDAVTAFLCRAAQTTPLVLVLDDLHWADKPSLLMLEFLAPELSRSRLLVVGTYRDVDLSRQHPLSETLAELTRERSLQRLLLRGLHREEVRSFMTLSTGITPPEVMVQAVYTQTEGNLLFLTEVVRLLVQEGELTPERLVQPASLSLRIPEGVRDVIGKRLNRLSPDCNQVLTLAAVIGREFSLKEVVRLFAAWSEEHVLGLLEEAVVARVLEEVPQAVGWYQFTHALMRATLYDELTTVRRVQLHRHIGEALEALYSTNLEPHLHRLAHHFCAAAQSGAADKAIAYAERAGARAAAVLAYEEAVHHYQMALQSLERLEPVPEAQQCTLLLALGEAQRKAGEYPQALETFQRAADLARRLEGPENLAYAALGFEETSWRPGLPGDVAARLLEEALRGLGEADSILKARVLGGLARAMVFSGALTQAAVVEQQAAEMARRLGDPTTLAATLKTRFFVRWRPEHIATRLATVTELLRLADEVGDGDLVLQAYSWRLFDLMDLGDMPAVEAQLEAHTRLAEEFRQPFYLYINVTFRAMRAIFEGHFEAGEQLAQQAFTIGQRLRGQDALGVFGVQMFMLRREQGRLQELAPIVAHFVQTSPAASIWRPGLALIYSELGCEPEAREEFERLAAHDFADIPQDAVWSTCIVYLTKVCTFLGDARRASILYQCLTPFDGYNITVGPTAACYGAAARYLGMLATTMARWDEAQRHFADALAMNARTGAKPWLAHTQYEYARMLLVRGHAGDDETAVSLLEAALTVSRALGMRALEGHVVALQEHTRAQVCLVQVYPCGLTRREVEVLRLIAAGKSNRDIAAGLFISPNTVANHVRNILTKTSTANRTEAAAFAIRHGLLEA
jgi:DNA-binding CsgD family transcriptional regulator/tetratricopeptide (TPR) repeat protein